MLYKANSNSTKRFFLFIIYTTFYKKPIYNKLESNFLNSKNQSRKLKTFKKLKNNFAVCCRSESLFSFTINTKRLFLYANYDKNIKFHHSSLVSEQKKLSYVSHSIPGSNRNKKPLKIFTSKLRANS